VGSGKLTHVVHNVNMFLPLTYHTEQLADSQLWSTAMLVQGLRALLPMGGIWMPILDDLVKVVNALQGEAIERVSFYKATTGFVNDLKTDSTYKSIQVTGHSLGGGLAIITGAQSGVPAVAVSGPNARLSGSSFEPEVTHEQLDRYTFNIVPARNPIARFDDVANQFDVPPHRTSSWIAISLADHCVRLCTLVAQEIDPSFACAMPVMVIQNQRRTLAQGLLRNYAPPRRNEQYDICHDICLGR
jgi:hypothetical protein